MLLAPLNDQVIVLPDGNVLVIKSADPKPAISYSEYADSGLYQNGKIIYSIPVKGSPDSEYIHDDSGRQVIVINNLIYSSKSLVVYRDGVEVNSLLSSELGVGKRTIELTRWYPYWGSFSSKVGNEVRVNIYETNFYLWKLKVPLLSSGEIAVDVNTDKIALKTPVNYMLWYGSVVVALFVVIVVYKVFKSRNV
jgi:hypothetical protein